MNENYFVDSRRSRNAEEERNLQYLSEHKIVSIYNTYSSKFSRRSKKFTKKIWNRRVKKKHYYTQHFFNQTLLNEICFEAEGWKRTINLSNFWYLKSKLLYRAWHNICCKWNIPSIDRLTFQEQEEKMEFYYETCKWKRMKPASKTHNLSKNKTFPIYNTQNLNLAKKEDRKLYKEIWK